MAAAGPKPDMRIPQGCATTVLMERVIVMGCPGAGKSTAAKRLAGLTDIPVVHLDAYYWQPGWKRPETNEWEATLTALIQQPRWIMDGNYGGTLPLRLAAADTLIHLDYSTALCLRRAVKRAILGRGHDRQGELPAGCPERLDWAFFSFVANYRRHQRITDLQRIEGFDGTVYRFTSPNDLERFLANFEKRV